MINKKINRQTQKALLLSIITFICSSLYAQQYNNQNNQDAKGSYLTVSGGIGSSSLVYKLTYQIKNMEQQGNRKKSNLGYNFEIRYSYYFDTHWGMGTGFGVSRYGATGKIKGDMSDDKYMILGQYTDDDVISGNPREYELRARLQNIQERQTAYLLDIPLMLLYQTRFGEEQIWGMYGGAGIKLQIPTGTNVKIRDEGLLNVSGYYPHIPTDMGAPSLPPVPQHGYGTVSYPQTGLCVVADPKLKIGVAGTAELGLMVNVYNGVDLMIGGYIDYGFTDLKNRDYALLGSPENYQPAANKKVGEGISYNGMLNSTVTDKIKVFSFGGKIAVRLKL